MHRVISLPLFDIYEIKMQLKIDVPYNQMAIAAKETDIKSTTEIFQQFLLEASFLRAPVICLSPWPLLLFIWLLTRLRPSCWAMFVRVTAEGWEMKQSWPPWPSGIAPAEKFSALCQGHQKEILSVPTPYPPRPVDRDMETKRFFQEHSGRLGPTRVNLVWRHN